MDGGVHVPVMTRAPELLEFVQADYPREAQASGKGAQVRLQVTIAADGTVAEAVVTGAAGDGFDEAAVSAVKRFRFSPAEVDGVPAPIQVDYLYNFELRPVADAGAADAGPAAPAKASLTGRLTARGSRNRIAGGIVACSNQTAGAEVLSDDEGRFQIEVEAGLCKMRVVANGFETYETEEALEPGESREVVYYVRPKVIGYETVVRGQREKKEVVRRTLERAELQKVPGSFGDPIRVIQNFPGVARAPFLGGQLIVRGAAPSQTLTFLDGVEIPLLFHLGGGPSVVNGEFLERIDFYPGGFGARYGRAIGGVIDVATRKGAADTWHGSAKVDLLDSSLFFEAPLTEGVSVAAAARRSYIDAILPLVLPKDPNGGGLLIVPVYWDYQVRMDFGTQRDEAKKGGATGWLMAFGSDDVLKVVASGGARDRDVSVDVHTLFHRVVGNYDYRVGNATYRLTPYVGYDLASANFGGTKINVDRFELGLRADLGLDITEWFTFHGGFDVLFDHLIGRAELPVISDTQYIGFPGAEPKTESQRFLRNIDSFDGAAYLEADFKLGPVTVTPGLRLSTAFLNGQTRHAFDPRLWVRYKMFDWTELKGSVGLYTQPPSAFNMEQPPLGTPTLTHEKAFQTSVGVMQRFSDFITLDVTGYFNRRFDNVVSPGPTVINADGSVTDNRFANNGLGRAYGMEVMLRHEISERFFGWVAYTLSRAEESRVGGDRVNLGSFDQTHILTMVGSLRLFWGFELGGRFRYVTGRPKTPLAHPYDLYQADSNDFIRQTGLFRSTRQKPFHQLDLRLDKNFLFSQWTLTVYLDVQNVYNAANVEATMYDYRNRTEIDVPGIPVLPVLGIKGAF